MGSFPAPWTGLVATVVGDPRPAGPTVASVESPEVAGRSRRQLLTLGLVRAAQSESCRGGATAPLRGGTAMSQAPNRGAFIVRRPDRGGQHDPTADRARGRCFRFNASRSELLPPVMLRAGCAIGSRDSQLVVLSRLLLARSDFVASCGSSGLDVTRRLEIACARTGPRTRGYRSGHGHRDATANTVDIYRSQRPGGATATDESSATLDGVPLGLARTRGGDCDRRWRDRRVGRPRRGSAPTA